MISSTTSAVDPEAPSIFEYFEKDGAIWGGYTGDTVTFGKFVGTRTADTIWVSFVHVLVADGRADEHPMTAFDRSTRLRDPSPTSSVPGRTSGAGSGSMGSTGASGMGGSTPSGGSSMTSTPVTTQGPSGSGPGAPIETLAPHRCSTTAVTRCHSR